MQLRASTSIRLTLLLAALQSMGPRAADAQCPALVWSDEFDGEEVELTKWEFLQGNGCSIGLCGWGNEELQWYLPENAVVEDGFLHIIAREQTVSGHAFTSARMQTEGQGEWTFGRFEGRMKLPEGQGIWPAFWMMPTDPKYGGWPQSGEIDVMESRGHVPDLVHGTVHYGTGSSTSGTFELHDAAFSEGFHEFAVERESGAIRWFVDGYLYHEVRQEDVAPLLWPFDEPFHFLLNVAIGGRFPGDPNESTVFPDSMTVDYLRVYDAPRAQIAGPRVVVHEAQGVAYTITNAPEDATVTWQVPDGARIADGQGTAEVTVDWGQAGGTVEAVASSACGDQRLGIDVEVGAAFEHVQTFAAFEGTDEMSVGGRTTGSMDVRENRAPSEINSSAESARYQRSPSQQYDVLYLEAEEPLDAEAFAEGDLQFRLDLLSEAPPRTEIILQLEDGALTATSAYPIGRHSRYRALTGPEGVWEHLIFEPLDRPDPNMDPTGVSSAVILFAPNTYTSHIFYLDNFEAYGRPEEPNVARDPEPVIDVPDGMSLTAYPNPFAGQTTLQYHVSREAEVRLTIFDLTGREIRRLVATRQAPGQYTVRFDAHDLPAGIYVGRLIDGRRVSTTKIVSIRQ